MNKKLQVFISSTYTDLRAERQSAVQAILNAGHIPAGMELFTAGDESQLETIYKWIDNSDVYMLILGGRYGSIEPKSNKSYTQLEFEYAVGHQIPFFSLVLSDDFINEKVKHSDYRSVIETEHPSEYKEFKSSVTSKIVEFVHDAKDIQLGILKSLNTIQQSYDLIGWVRSDAVPDISFLSQNLQRIATENAMLKSQISERRSELIGDYSFDELCEILSAKNFELPDDVCPERIPRTINALTFFVEKYGTFCTGVTDAYGANKLECFLFKNCFPYFESYGLVQLVPVFNLVQRFHVTNLGRKFFTLYDSKKVLE